MKSIQKLARAKLRKRMYKAPALVVIESAPMTQPQIRVYLKPCEPLPEDMGFLLRLLPIKAGLRRELVEGYRREWLQAMAAEPLPHKKQNAGRRAANIWLKDHCN